MYALSFLLTGARAHAHAVVRRAVALQPAFEQLGAIELDRLIVLCSRELKQRREPIDAPSGHEAIRLFEAALGLESSAREAWILREIILLDETHAARAMDCSKNALRRFLESARESLARAATPAALDALRVLADRVGDGAAAVELAVSLGREHRRTQHVRHALYALAVLVLIWVTAEYATWRIGG